MSDHPAPGYHASDGAAYDRFLGRWTERLAVLFADFARLPGDGAVLDVGCGTGSLAAELARRRPDGQVIGVDVSASYLAFARARHATANLRFERCDGAHLTFDALLLRIETDGDARDFRLARSDLGGLVNMLLALASMEWPPDIELAGESGSPSLPAASLSLGEAAEGQALLGIEVGAVQLAFNVPRTAIVSLAYAMLAATADSRSVT